MAIDALVKPLLNVPLFQGLKPLQITEIARRAERVVFKAGDTIIAEDATGDAAILIVAGDAVRTTGPDFDGAPEPVPPGALVGEMAMLVETKHTSTIMARGSVRALRITRSELVAQMEDDPALADHFVQKIAGRLNRLAKELRAIDAALGGLGTAARQAAHQH
ncbi:MAG: cyclic nucleotide-binding domain-containing protein [Hyphomicrobiaceae bacterium]|nr:cyclic nucleotide-binding domain-containing protein [Hyphomicrobiaceae bacterium]